MKTVEIKKLTESNNYDSSLHLFCDNYCEYCIQTQKCLNYSILKKDLQLSDIDDPANALFWQQFEDEFDTIVKEIETYADTIGFDLDATFEDNKTLEGKKHKFYTQALRIASETNDVISRTDEFIEMRKNHLSGKIALKLKKKKIIEDNSLLFQVNDPIFWLTEQFKYKLAVAIDLRLNKKNALAAQYAQIAYSMLKKLILLWSAYIDKIKVAEVEFMPLVIEIYWTYLSIKRVFPLIKA